MYKRTNTYARRPLVKGMMPSRKCIASIVTLTCIATSAHAHDSVHGAVQNSMPQSVDFGDTEDNDHIRAFYETGCEPLPYDVEVNLDPQVHDADYIYNEDGAMPEAADPG